MKHRFLVASFVGLSTLFSACAGGVYSVRVGPPPPPRAGIVGFAPGPGYVWTDGYWDLRGSQWVWADGRWLRPPRPGAVWVRPSWEHRGRRYRFHQGHWR